MNSEPRNSPPSLTPSELAALLGPRVTPAVEPPQANVPDACWTTFADGFARSLTSRLRSLIRAAVRVTPHGNLTLTADAAMTSHGTRSVVSVWQPSHSLEPLAIVLSPPLVATFVDRLLGGRSAPNCETADQNRPLTDVDHRLAARLSNAIRLSVIEQATTDNTWELTELSDASSFADAWLPDYSLLRLSFELQFAQGGGSLDLLLPLEVADVLADEPLADSVPLTPFQPQPLEANSGTSRRLSVVAQFAPTLLSGNDLQSLAVGDVLLLDSATDSSLRVLVDGRLRFHAAAGTIDRHKAVRLTTATNAQ
ncbi:MAG: FliM/FliN family flagellar motor switch protein [Planctomycetaceae bacterium]|nr:FliM/FliN family flagellar motor switch protein [Planctomycetaceae bacterium]